MGLDIMRLCQHMRFSNGCNKPTDEIRMRKAMDNAGLVSGHDVSMRVVARKV
jgi:hypothetical protein